MIAMSSQHPADHHFYCQRVNDPYIPQSAYYGSMNSSAELLALFGMPHQSERADLTLIGKPVEEASPSTWPASSSKKAKVEPSGPCVVCKSEKAGYHFGVSACAACSAFFRRTISENRKYVCRKTGPEHNKCPIDKRHRCYCRACRLQKCLEKGMDPTAVQPHRDSIGSKLKGPTSAQPNAENLESSSPIDPTCPLFINTKTDPIFVANLSLPFVNKTVPDNLIVPKTELIDVEGCSQENTTRSVDCHSVSSDYSSCSGYDSRRNLVEITVTEYRKLLERRRLFYCSSSVRDIVGGAMPEARPAKYFDKVRHHHSRIEVVLFVEFLNQIHPFSQLSVDDKVVLMKHLSVPWSILEKYYCTMKGGGLETNRIIHCDGTYTDLENPTAIEFDDKLVAGERLDKDTLNKLFITPLRDALREISGPMFHYKMTDVEFSGLTAILLFDPTARGLSEQARPLVKETRNRVYHDWFAYYRAHNIGDASEKMGNTMLLLPAVQTTVERTAENLRLIRFFELFEYDPLVDDLLP